MMNDDDDDLWKNSLEVDVVMKEKYNNGPMIAILQMVGINSQTHTVFGRLVMTRNGPRSSYGRFVLGSNKETMVVPDSDNGDDDNLSPTTTTSILILDLLNLMLREILRSKVQVEDDGTNLLPYSATELLKLGSVWSLSNVKNQNKQIVNIVRKRLSIDDAYKLIRFNDGDGSSTGGSVVDSLRLHCRPSRFPFIEQYDWSVDNDGQPQHQQHNCYQNTKPSLIMHHDPNLGYTVVNKPCGIPSHATVDNGIENVLYQLEKQQQQNNHNFSLPQRLDIETCGLLIVANRPEFSSYMGKLLEKKSIQSLDIIDFDDDDNMQSEVIQKEYKCLVHLVGEQDRSRLLQRLKATNGIITHYMDPKSIAPKTFIEEKDMSEKGEDDGWLKCVMYVRKVGGCVQWKQQKNNSCLRSQQADDDRLCVMMEIHLLLLTGRTHQVRGQMAAMNMPLVGDLLYGGKVSLSKFTIDKLWDENRHRNSTAKTTTTSESSNCNNNNKNSLLALQCCSIRFSKPEWACNTIIPPRSSCVEPKTPKDKNNKQKKTKKKRRPMLVESRSSLLSFHLDEAWWTKKIEHLNHD